MSDSTHPIYDIIAKLDAAKITHTLHKTRHASVMIVAYVPGRHYEIEVFAGGQVEVEIYESSGEIGGHELIDEMLRDFGE